MTWNHLARRYLGKVKNSDKVEFTRLFFKYGESKEEKQRIQSEDKRLDTPNKARGQISTARPRERARMLRDGNVRLKVMYRKVDGLTVNGKVLELIESGRDGALHDVVVVGKNLLYK